MRLIKNNFLSLIIATIISVLFFIFMQKYFITKNFKQKLSISEKKLLDETIQTLISFDEKQNNEYFEQLLDGKMISKNIYQTEKCYFYINFSQKLSSFDYFYANNFYLNTKRQKLLCFISLGTTNEFNELIKENQFNYLVFGANDIFTIIKLKNLYPKSQTKQINNSTKKIVKFKNNFVGAISKARFKEFFFSGLSLVAISVIVPFSLYYLISGTLFLIVSILCLVVKKSNDSVIKSKTKIGDCI